MERKYGMGERSMYSDNSDKIQRELQTAKMIRRQIAQMSTDDDTDGAMKRLLASLGECMGADRAYIFEKKGELYPNTYEWCAKGVEPALEKHQEITLRDIQGLIPILEKGECFIVSDIEDINKTIPFMHDVLKKHDIHNLISAPILLENEVMGFIGVSNAEEELTELISESLITVGSFIGIMLKNHRGNQSMMESRNALRDANHTQNVLLDSLDIGVFSYTLPERKILILNTEAKRLFDYSGDENLSDYLNVMHKKIAPADYRSLLVVTATLKKPDDIVKYTFHITNDSGETLAVRCNSKLLSFSDGQRYILSTLRDITLQEQLEEGLDEERRQYREALSLNSYLSFNIDLTDGYFNQTIMAKDGKEIVGKNRGGLPISYNDVMKSSVGSQHPVFLTKDADVIMTREALIDWYHNESSHFSGEYFLEDLGRYYHTLALLSESKSNDGHINANVLVYDTTERKQAEEMRRSIIESFGSVYFASWILDFSENKLEEITAPDFASSITELGAKDIKDGLDYYINHFVAKEYKEAMMEFLDLDTLKERINSGEMIAYEYLGTVKGWCRVNFIPVRDDSERVILAVQEIDKEKKKENEIKMALQRALESASSANLAKTDFFEKMSHDIRTPLNGIIGMTAIAEAHITEQERVEDCLKKIMLSGNHLLRLVNEVLDMSKIESGRMKLQNDSFCLRQTLDELTEIIKPQMEEKNHTFCLSVGELKHDMVIGDVQKLQQVILNLISNSVKYTQNGGKICLSVCELPIQVDKAGCYEFIVEDNGIGMSEEFLKNLFEPFTRADDTRIQKIQGTGLGMTIVKSIVQMMNGTVRVESKLNQGSKFIVTIFLKHQNAKEQSDFAMSSASKEAQIIRQDVNYKGKRVLLVEDNELNAEIAGEILGMAGLEIEYAVNGEEAVSMVKEAQDGYYDMIFMDLLMPIMNGYEATKTIRALPREYAKTVPIIAMTANAFVEDVKACMEAGMNEHIAKPIDFGQLHNALNRWLNRDAD